MSVLTTVIQFLSGNTAGAAASVGESAGQSGPTGLYHDAQGVVRGVKTDVNAVSSGVSDIGTAITDVGDFLSYIAWLFYPLNLLRAAEFVTGLFLFYLGIKPYIGGGRLGGSGSTRVIRATLSATPVGRTQREISGRRMGRREGQREAARMEARQEVTRPQREASARERVRINREARRSN